MPEAEIKHCKHKVAEDCELIRRRRVIAGESERRHQPCAPEATAADPSASPRRPSKTEDLGLRGTSRTGTTAAAIQRRECGDHRPGSAPGRRLGRKRAGPPGTVA